MSRRLHRPVFARLPALLQLAEDFLGLLLQSALGPRVVTLLMKARSFLGLGQLARDLVRLKQ